VLAGAHCFLGKDLTGSEMMGCLAEGRRWVGRLASSCGGCPVFRVPCFPLSQGKVGQLSVVERKSPRFSA